MDIPGERSITLYHKKETHEKAHKTYKKEFDYE